MVVISNNYVARFELAADTKITLAEFYVVFTHLALNIVSFVFYLLHLTVLCLNK